jgi:hypothetical protein
VSLSDSKNRGRTPGRPARRALITGVFGVLVVALAGCGATAPKATAKTTVTTHGSTSTTTNPTHPQAFLAPETKFGTSQVGDPDTTTSVPTERGTRPISPLNDAGQEVIIDESSYALPYWLVADVTLPITWTNLSGKPQQIVFDDAPVRSPVLAPGATFTWKSPGYAINFTYHIVNGHNARITLQSPNAGDS